MATQKKLITIPGYRSAEYVLILSPHEGLQEKILKVKKSLFLEGDNTILLNRKPVIRLAHFYCLEMLEEKVLRHLKMSTMGMPSMKIHLEGYKSFPTHTLYIPVENKLPIQKLIKEIQPVKKLIRSAKAAPHFYEDFYIPLAVKLKPGRYEYLWNQLKHRQFTGHFIADAVLVLKREEGNTHFKIAARLDLLNQPVLTQQGNLFS